MNLLEDWENKWEEALKLWSDYVKLSSPHFLFSEKEETQEGLTASFAAIRLTDHKVLLSVKKIKNYHLENYPLEIMGHEIGHHVYCPGDISDQGKLIYLVQTAMPRFEHVAPMIVNVYTDLFINDRLKRHNGLRMEEVYQKLGKQKGRFWNFYMRTYEILWALPKETLTNEIVEDDMESDAMLVNRIVRNFPNDWLRGAFDFGNICYPYFIGGDPSSSLEKISILHDTAQIGKGGNVPSGITEVEIESIFDEGKDPSLSGGKTKEISSEKKNTPSLSPAQYSAICEALGVKVSESEKAYKYYKEKALPHLISFPEQVTPGAPELILEGNESWDLGSPLENINWVDSVIKSPIVIPGYTTVENNYGETPSYEKNKNPIDLDLFVDCSGSMPNPLTEISYLTLAGTILALSALRTGAKVRATLWSGEKEYETTKTFIRDENSILKILTGYIGWGTCFPLDLLEEEYSHRSPQDRKTHILVISDEGIDTMFTQEYHTEPRPLVKSMLQNAGGGGSLVLNLYNPQLTGEIQQMKEDGWDIYPITGWEQLVAFSRNFVRKNYERNQILHKTNH